MRRRTKPQSVAGVTAPTPKPTPYALLLIALVLSAIVAIPLWVIEAVL